MSAPPIAASTIVQQAFRFMEKTPPASFDDASQEAAAAAEQFPLAIRAMLEKADWSFASKLAYLQLTELPVTGAADPDLPYTFGLPGDLITIREIGDGRIRWRRDIEGIRCEDAIPLRCRYTCTITNEALLPAEFQRAVSARLATLLGPQFLSTQSKIAAIAEIEREALREAKRAYARDASDARYDGLADIGDWVDDARWGYGTR